MASIPPLAPSTTLVLHPRYDEDSQLLWQEAIRRGWEVARVSYEGKLAERVGTKVDVNRERIAIYGGYMWGPVVAEMLGVKLLSPPADWLVTLPEQFTRRWVKVSTVGGVRSGEFGWPIFVKSLHGKVLASRVYASTDDLPDVGDDVQVIVQEPVNWNFEYRCFVDWRGVRACSRYATFGELDMNPPADSYATEVAVPEFMRKLLTQWLVPVEIPSWVCGTVIDVGLIEGRGMAVVEANPAWCSAVYGCGPAEVLDVVASACVKVRP